MTTIADQLKINIVALLLISKTKQIFLCAGLLCFAFYTPISAQVDVETKRFRQAEEEFDNGNYAKAIELAENEVKKTGANEVNTYLYGTTVIANSIIANSQISSGSYEDAARILEQGLQKASENKANKNQKAKIYLSYSSLRRFQRKFAEAFDYSKKALAADPENKEIQAEYYLSIGRIMFASGYDVSAIIWLEKAEKLLDAKSIGAAKLDIYRFLSLAWSSKLNYQAALKYSQKLVSVAANTRFKYKHRQALFELATLFGATGQKEKAVLTLEKGLKLSVTQGNLYQAGNFLSSLILHSLDGKDVVKAADYLNKLEKLDSDDLFSFEKLLGRAVLSAFQNQPEIAEKLFAELDKKESTSDFVLLYWKIIVAEQNQDWEQVIKLNQTLLELTQKDNFIDGLPAIYLTFAKAYFRLSQTPKTIESLEKSLSYVEEIRKSDNQNLSLGLLETYHDAYRLLTQTKVGDVQEAFELADFLKARVLKDRINNSLLKSKATVSPAIRKKLEELSLRFVNEPNIAAEIEKNETLIANQIPELNLVKPDLTTLDKISDLNETAVVSYFFTLDKKLLAIVWEKNKPIQSVILPVTENEAETYAKTTQQKIENLIFFKKDGKELYDKLLKPLNLSSRQLVIVPDKFLWKLPFQAFSPDGAKYLIEEKTISYAPSISILIDQLKMPKPKRQTIQAFANSSFDNQFLQFVNDEANRVAGIYETKPILAATMADFKRVSSNADILHFSMHAEVNGEQPLESFLAFKKTGTDNGRLTVEDILQIKLKKGSLAFLASCDTNNVFNGEGLVSLAWAMMGAGATTVISAQWEANDKSTQIFTKAYYRFYKEGFSASESMQKASLELIKNKSSDMHEPYYWADFTLSGDFR